VPLLHAEFSVGIHLVPVDERRKVLARGIAPPAAKLKLVKRRGTDMRRARSVIELISSSPRSAPSFCATAMARSSATIGEGRIVINVS
jgi:hypothetical protein